jgi:hypothetical protein
MRHLSALIYVLSGCLLAILAGSCEIAMGSSAASNSTGPTFFDGTFNDADWRTTTITQLAGSTVVESQQLTNGHPGAYRQFVGSWNLAGNFNLEQFHYRPDAVYDPSTQGAIVGLVGSFDQGAFDNSQVEFDTQLALEQDGVIYRGGSGYGLGGAAGWYGPVLQSLSAYQFSPTSVPAAIHPDFSASGDPITFGYITEFSFPSGGTRTAGIDNWYYSITNSPVPEPASLGMLFVAATAILVKRRRARPAQRANWIHSLTCRRVRTMPPHDDR